VESFSQVGLMRGVRKAIFLLAALPVVGNAQCMAICGATECSHPAPKPHDSGNLPPCHQHHGPKQSTVTKPCIDSMVVVDDRSSSPSLDRHSFELLVADPGVGGNRALPVVTVHALPGTSPPIPVEDRSTLILRI